MVTVTVHSYFRIVIVETPALYATKLSPFTSGKLCSLRTYSGVRSPDIFCFKPANWHYRGTVVASSHRAAVQHV